MDNEKTEGTETSEKNTGDQPLDLDQLIKATVEGERVVWGIDPVKNKGALPPVSGMGLGKGWALLFSPAFFPLKTGVSSPVRPLIRHSNRGYPADNLWVLTPFQTFTSPPKLLWLRFVREGGRGATKRTRSLPINESPRGKNYGK